MATLKEVARLAAVSPMTVSRVFRDARRVAPATRQRVLDVCRRCGYVPHSAARAMRRGCFHRIAFVLTRYGPGGSAGCLMLGKERGQQMERQVRVVIADDRPATRRGLKALLALLPQVEVVGEAGDGQESLDLVAECKPDVVLMDVQMPVMDGVEATRRIKRDWPHVKVIALTMYAGHRAEALAAGADAFLLKDGAVDTLEGAILAQGNDAAGRSGAWDPGMRN